ncbi:MAG: hypothetical protein ABMA14_11000 [Hyphomonadaceae bacterium]
MTIDTKPPGRWAYFKRMALWLGMLWTCQVVMYVGNELAHVMVVDDLTLHLQIAVALAALAAVLAAIPDLI